MDYLFYQVAAINGFDAVGHYLRAGLILNACSQYAIAPRRTAWRTSHDTTAVQRTRGDAPSVPGYADTRRSDSLRKLDAYFAGKTLQLATTGARRQRPRGRQGDGRATARAGAPPAATGASPAAAAPTAPRRAAAGGRSDQAAGAALLDYLLGGDG